MFGILVFGDSIVQGRGEVPSFGWTGRLKKDFESKDYYNVLYNLGIPGESSTYLLKRFEIEIKNRINYIRDKDKFIILIGIGINDSRGLGLPSNNETPIEQFNKNIKELINIAKKYTSNVALISLTPVDESLVNPYENTYFNNELVCKYNKIILDNVEKAECDFIDVYQYLINLNYEKLLQDGLHPNSEGYKKMFNFIKSKLIELKYLEDN